MVEFATFTPEEQATVDAITERAVAMYRRLRVPVSALTIQMNLAAVHAHTPLRLAELLDADDFNFSHDVGGIARHLSRKTGKLENCFRPRFASHAAV